MPMLSRRALFRLLAAAPSSYALSQSFLPLPARRSGELDIHHIDTGRGNSTLIVGPDGTTLLVDAGASAVTLDTSAPHRPNASRRPGEWIARYAQKVSHADYLDYALITHIHPDHTGDVTPGCPLSSSGAYRLTGISDVDAILPIRTVIDRAFPDFGAAKPLNAPFAANYLAYLQERVAKKRAVQSAMVGSISQLQLKDVQTRVLAANGRIWTGSGTSSRLLTPQGRALSAEEQPNENFYSIALRLQFGNFSYYTGGDLACDTHDGRVPWLDNETPVARLAGRTDVAAANHHGYFDSTGAAFTDALDAQAYIVQAWDVGHPGPAQAQRMLGEWPGAKKHDVYALESLPANALINSRFTPRFKSRQGHVVVRVAADTKSFRIHLLDATNEDMAVRWVSDPYRCRG